MPVRIRMILEIELDELSSEERKVSAQYEGCSGDELPTLDGMSTEELEQIPDLIRDLLPTETGNAALFEGSGIYAKVTQARVNNVKVEF